MESRVQSCSVKGSRSIFLWHNFPLPLNHLNAISRCLWFLNLASLFSKSSHFFPFYLLCDGIFSEFFCSMIPPTNLLSSCWRGRKSCSWPPSFHFSRNLPTACRMTRAIETSLSAAMDETLFNASLSNLMVIRSLNSASNKACTDSRLECCPCHRYLFSIQALQSMLKILSLGKTYQKTLQLVHVHWRDIHKFHSRPIISPVLSLVNIHPNNLVHDFHHI